MNKNWLLIIPLTCLLLFTGSTDAHAAKNVNWQIERIGVFSMPEGWQTTDLLQVFSTVLKEANEKTQAKKPAPSLPLPPVDPLASLSKINLQVYQLTSNDGKAYRTAVLLFYRHDKLMTAGEKAYFTQELSDVAREKLETTITTTTNSLKKQLVSSTELNASVPFLEISRPDYLKINDRPAYGLSARIVLSTYGINMPYYVKGYAFNANGFTSAAFLLTVDSERNFWDPQVRKIIQSFEPAKTAIAINQ
ncbi:MAG: hypothetical protein K0R22_2920 [Sporomusa sp.]|nr:hypothetical protein [Sporomusa sp.]